MSEYDGISSVYGRNRFAAQDLSQATEEEKKEWVNLSEEVTDLPLHEKYNPNYEPNFLYDELSDQQEARIRSASKYGHLKTWKLCRLIVKCGDDLRLE